ncbi:MAG: 3-deoxy-D-manno-octulosonic acid transferase [Bdellovibrionia bacterium]
MIIWLYSLFYFFLFLLLQTLRPFLSGKIRTLVEEKNLGRFRNPGGQHELNPIWIHAASGEIEYAKPFIRALKKQYPHLPLLVTFSSPSAISLIEKIEEVDFWGPCPWDLPWEIDTFIKRWNPRAVFFARTDVWPMLSLRLRQHKIPSYLISATFSENSSRLKTPIHFITFATLAKLTQIFCVSSEDQNNLKKHGYQTDNLSVLGDTRYEQVLYRLNHPKKLKPEIKPQPQKTIIFGSTWPEDEAFLLKSLPTLKNNNLQIIWAPHEPTPSHLHELTEQIRASQGHLNVAFYSQALDSNWDILLVDQVGILAELYTWGSCAFVGGSFKAQVHSVMEALAAGLPVAVGPFYKNNREALDFKQVEIAAQLMAVSVVHESHDFEQWTNRVLVLSKHERENLQHLIEERAHTTSALLSQLPHKLFAPSAITKN